MLIKVSDNVSVNVRKILPREGKITGIQISSTVESGLNEYQVGEYNTDMGYNGSIGYVTENGDQYWAYFSQIEKVI
jgi:hypothetical protein